MLNYIIDMMMGSGLRLNTRVENLDRATLREVVKYATQYCTDTFGTRKKKVPFSVSIVKQRSGEPAYGQYCPYDNKLFIYHNNCPTVKLVIQTVIHEYTHYLQPVKTKYHKLMDIYGYDDHPMEIEARDMEQEHYKDCWNYIKEILC
jgi:Zn-dependent peptidase ImmA (M78 family)